MRPAAWIVSYSLAVSVARRPAEPALLENHGLTGVNLGPHLLRHSTISVLLSDGHAPAAVSKLAGHSSTRVTLTTYAHALKQDEAAITASLGRLSGG